VDGAALVYEDLANNAARKPDREMAARVVKVLRARAVQHRSFASTCWQAVAKEQAPAPVRRCSYGRCEAVLQPEELGPQCDACNEHGL
jgi:hypothetical protein